MQPATASSPVTTYAALALVALLAAVGWWRAVDQGGKLEQARAASAATTDELNGKIAGLERRLAGTAAAGAELDALKARIAEATRGIGERLAVLKEREHQVAAVEATLRKRGTVLETVEREAAQAGSKLNARLRTLGEQEREQVEIDRRLAELKDRQAASEAELAGVQGRINERLRVLGEREKTLADQENRLRLAAHRVERLERQEAELGPRLQAMRGELYQMDVELVAKKQAAEDNWARVGKAKQALEDLRQLVSQQR